MGRKGFKKSHIFKNSLPPLGKGRKKRVHGGYGEKINSRREAKSMPRGRKSPRKPGGAQQGKSHRGKQATREKRESNILVEKKKFSFLSSREKQEKEKKLDWKKKEPPLKDIFPEKRKKRDKEKPQNGRGKKKKTKKCLFERTLYDFLGSQKKKLKEGVGIKEKKIWNFTGKDGNGGTPLQPL